MLQPRGQVRQEHNTCGWGHGSRAANALKVPGLDGAHRVQRSKCPDSALLLVAGGTAPHGRVLRRAARASCLIGQRLRRRGGILAPPRSKTRAEGGRAPAKDGTCTPPYRTQMPSPTLARLAAASASPPPQSGISSECTGRRRGSSSKRRPPQWQPTPRRASPQ